MPPQETKEFVRPDGLTVAQYRRYIAVYFLHLIYVIATFSFVFCIGLALVSGDSEWFDSSLAKASMGLGGSIITGIMKFRMLPKTQS